MGRDKALIPVAGVPLAARAAAALVAAGADLVAAIGGAADPLRALGLVPVPDARPGEGPLGGLATALAWAPVGAVVLLAPCDLARPDPCAFTALLEALAADEGADGAVAVAGGRLQPTVAAWRARPALVAALVGCLEAGARRLDTAGSVGRALEVTVADAAVADLDTPDDLTALDRH